MFNIIIGLGLGGFVYLATGFMLECALFDPMERFIPQMLAWPFVLCTKDMSLSRVLKEEWRWSKDPPTKGGYQKMTEREDKIPPPPKPESFKASPTKPTHDPFKKNEPVLPTRTVEGPILGYRWWTIKLHKGRYVLQSLTNETLWTERTLQCTNGHGIYCYKNLDMGVGEYPVYGEIEIYGQVVIHENGYRAERALVRRLWLWEAEWLPNFNGPLNIGVKSYFKVKQFEKAAHDLEERYECSVETEPGRVYEEIMTAHRWKQENSKEESWKSEESLKSSKSSPLVSQRLPASTILALSQQNVVNPSQYVKGNPFLSPVDVWKSILPRA
ncbi:hypothetical protein LCGC14_2602000 [marine sediment metagenome]|uniref:Uncharacterized protein n=1 Tax=marine sediment metagenome TaxID=412755 RepID=A0A0F9CJH0_9ZZZZ